MGATGRLYSFFILSLCDLPDHKLPHSLFGDSGNRSENRFFFHLHRNFGTLIWGLMFINSKLFIDLFVHRNNNGK